MLRVFSLSTFVIVVLSGALCRCQAQDTLDRDFSDFSGTRESDQLLNEENPVATVAKIRGGKARRTPSDSFYFLPSMLDDGHMLTSGFALAYTKNNGLQDLSHFPWQVKVAFPNLVHGGDQVDKYGIEGKVTLLRDDPRIQYKHGYRLTLISAYTHSQVSTETYAVSLAGSKQLGTLWTVATNIGFARKDVIKKRRKEAIKSAAGIDYVIDAYLDVSVDYAFNNVIDGQDNYSVTLTTNIPKTRDLVFLSVAKGGAVSVAMSVPFR